MTWIWRGVKVAWGDQNWKKVAALVRREREIKIFYKKKKKKKKKAKKKNGKVVKAWIFHAESARLDSRLFCFLWFPS